MDPELNAAAASPLPDLPPEVWEKILMAVMYDDIRNENKDDTINCRLVCTQWRSLIDKSTLVPKLLATCTWNPFFDAQMHAEGLANFPRTTGTRLSTRLEVEAFLSKWEEAADDADDDEPSPNPFELSSLFVEWKSNEDYIQVLERLPILFQKFGAFIRALKLYFDPHLPESVECLKLVFNLVNLRSVTIYVSGTSSANETLYNVIVRPDALPYLTDLGILGSQTSFLNQVLGYFSIAAGRSVQSIRIPGFHSLLDTTPGQFPNVDTVKVYQVSGETVHWNAAADDLRESDCIMVAEKLKSLWKVRRLSLKLWENEKALNPLVPTLTLLAKELNGPLEELYLAFPETSARLALEVQEEGQRHRAEARSHESLTLLALPYFMVEHLSVLREITTVLFGKHLTHLKFVYTRRRYLGDECGPLRDEVREAVRRTWPHVSGTVKWISVKFTKMGRDSSNRNKKMLTNVVWRYERTAQVEIE